MCNGSKIFFFSDCMLFIMAVRHIHTIEILDTERTDSNKRDRNWCTSEVSCEHTYSKDNKTDHETEPNITGKLEHVIIV